MHKKVFFSKVLQMALIMAVFNISNLCFGIFVSNRLGAEQTGLFHLIMNVQSIGISLSVSGMSLTATRLLSDMARERALICSDHIVGKCLRICLATSVSAAAVMMCASDFIASSLLARPDATPMLRALAPALVCVAVSAVLGGYFTAFGKVGAIGTGRLMGEAASWIYIAFAACSADRCIECTDVVAANVAAALVQCFCDVWLWRKSARTHGSQKSSVTTRHVIALCAPLAIGSYLRTGLSSAENLLIPSRLGASGVADSLAQYGIIKGMSMPVLFFPSVAVGAFVSLIVPEIARRRAQCRPNSIRYISVLSAQYILRFGFLVSAIFFVWSDEICGYVYSRAEAGVYLRMLSVLPLFMFFDSACDAILKGLDEQVFGLKVNIADAAMRVLLILLCVPIWGIRGYIYILYTSEILNLALSYWRLKKITALRFPLAKAVMIPLFAIWCSLGAVNLIGASNALSQILIFAAAYISITSLASPIFSRHKTDC